MTKVEEIMQQIYTLSLEDKKIIEQRLALSEIDVSESHVDKLAKEASEFYKHHKDDESAWDTEEEFDRYLDAQ